SREMMLETGGADRTAAPRVRAPDGPLRRRSVSSLLMQRKCQWQRGKEKEARPGGGPLEGTGGTEPPGPCAAPRACRSACRRGRRIRRITEHQTRPRAVGAPGAGPGRPDGLARSFPVGSFHPHFFQERAMSGPKDDKDDDKDYDKDYDKDKDYD